MNIKELKAVVARMAKIANKNSQICVGGDILGLPTHEIAYTYYTEAFDLDRVWVNFAQFKKIIAKLKKDVSFKVDDAFCIVAGGSTFKLKIEEPNLEMPKNEYYSIGTLVAEAVPELAKCAAVASCDELRPAMGCVLVEKDGTVVGTDAHTLHYKDTGSESEQDVLLPKSAISLLSGVEYDILVSEHQIKLASDVDVVEFSKIAGVFPRWRSILPDADSAETVVTFSEKELVEKLKEASVVGESVQLSEDLENVKVESRDLDTGSAYEAVLNGSECPGELNIAFNISQFLQMLNVIDSEELEMRFYDRTRAVTFNNCALLMPVIIS